jgi:hypothetical protein
MDKVTLALELLARLVRLQHDDAEPGLRVSLRTPDGEFVGEVVLPADTVRALTETAESLADFRSDAADAHRFDELIAELAAEQPQPEPGPVRGADAAGGALFAALHPDLAADITDLYNAIDPRSYLDDIVAADCPEAAQAAYEQLVTGEWDGEL